MTALFVIVSLLAVKTVRGRGLIETSVLQSPKHEMGSADYDLDGLCLHPTANDMIYATAAHALLLIDWSQNSDAATITVIVGGNSAGFVDGSPSQVQFHGPAGCTSFGNNIVIADHDNHALRSYDSSLDSVQTIIGGGNTDGVYTYPSSGPGVTYPVIIEALNSTHLIVAQASTQIRLIDTNSRTITTLTTSNEVLMSFFMSHDRRGVYLATNNENEDYNLYYMRLADLVAGQADMNFNTSIASYKGTENGEERSGSLSISVLHLHSYSWGCDAGEYLIMVNDKWLDVIEKSTLSTAVYTDVSEPDAVLLVPGNPGVIYVSDKEHLLRIPADGLEAPERVSKTRYSTRAQNSTKEVFSSISPTSFSTSYNPPTAEGIIAHASSSPVANANSVADGGLMSTRSNMPGTTTTTKKLHSKTTTKQPEETTTTTQPEKTTTTKQPEEATTTKQPEETTTTKQLEKTTTTKQPEEATTAKQPEKTTTTKQPEETTTTKQPEEATTTEQPEKTTPTEQPEEATTTEQPEKTTTTKQPEETTKQPEETTTAKQPEEATTTKQPEETIPTEQPEETTTTEQPEKTTTTKQPEEPTKQPEETTTTKQPEETTTTKQPEKITKTATKKPEATITMSKQPDETSAATSQPEKLTTSKQRKEATTSGIYSSVTRTEQPHETVSAYKKYTVKAKGLCPSKSIIEMIVADVQICSLYCSNTNHCAGFNFNKETGKCRLLNPWDKNKDILAGGQHDRCYER